MKEIPTIHKKLSNGYHIRPANLDDIPAMAELLNTCWIKKIGKALVEPGDLRNELSKPSVGLESDTRIIFAPDGNLVGYAAVFDTPPHVRAWVRVEVHPEYLGRGIGAALADWAEQRGQWMVAKAPKGARVVLMQDILENEAKTHKLLKGRGYFVARHSLEMLIEMETEPHTPVAPAGVTIRPPRLPQEERGVVEAIRLAFKGHWGYVEQPFENDLKEWGHIFYEAPNCDPELLFVAQAGDQLIGTCFSVLTPAESADSAWVFALGVLPSWRQRGLGLALLEHCFVELYRRGKTKVSLSVDAENLSGAIRLYEKAGMHMTRRFDIYERELRPGEELS